MFSQDMTILVRSGDIKPKYAIFKFLQSIILVLYCLFMGFYSFRSMYVIFSTQCVISENHKQIVKGAFFG
jgi:hypothetical protein